MSYDRASGAAAVFRICFVCTGNICRSPMAEAIFRSLIARHGFERTLAVSSAATGDWHVGERADERTLAALEARGYDGTAHRARQFDVARGTVSNIGTVRFGRDIRPDQFTLARVISIG